MQFSFQDHQEEESSSRAPSETSESDYTSTTDAEPCVRTTLPIQQERRKVNFPIHQSMQT